MLRKIVAILLLTIYSVCSTGATIYLHQCGKSLQFSLMEESKVSHDNCPMCNQLEENHEQGDHSSCHMESGNCSDSDCCKDIQVDLKSENEQQQTSSSAFLLFNFSPAIVILPWILTHWELLPEPANSVSSPAQIVALRDIEPVFILNCSFRI